MPPRGWEMTHPTPMTYNRAATAFVRTRRHLEQARDEARLALEILTRMELHPAPSPALPAERLMLLRKLESLLERLEATERDFAGARSGS